MSGERVERRLAAILAADVAGYSRLMGQDEAGTLARLRTHRQELIDPEIAEHKGRIVKTTGDGILIEFPSVVEAVACAVAVQRGMTERNVSTPEDHRMVFRIGVNLGDIIFAEDNDIHGDGVNVAARLEALAEPGGICVSGIVHDQVRDRLDITFDDMGEQSLKNIARPLRVYRVRRDPASNAAAGPSLNLPDKPSIAVLPFQNMSGDPEQEYFVDGMVEEIITALSRIRWLFVIARNSTFTYKGRPVDVKQVGRELGVRYVLEGSVRKGGGRVRITAQLIGAENGTHLWADRFDGSLEDVFDLQDRVAVSVAGVIEPALQAAEIRRSAQRPTSDLSAYDLYLRALSHFFIMQREGLADALNLLLQAIERDPRFAPALALMAEIHIYENANGWVEDPAKLAHKAIELAHQALRFGSDDPETVSRAAYALGLFGEDIDAAIALIDRSLVLNPSSADAWLRSGLLRLYAGECDHAIQHFEKSLRLDPQAMHTHQLTGIGRAHFFAGRFEEAVGFFNRAVQELPSYVTPYRFLAASYAHMDRLAEAREVIGRLRNVTPRVLGLDVPFVPYRKSEHRDLLLAGLRLAVGETT